MTAPLPGPAPLAEVANRVRRALGPQRSQELLDAGQALRERGGLPRRLLWTVTPGRSGTGALAHLLAGLRDVTAAHEPRPSFADALRAVQGQAGLALEYWVRRKLPALTRTRTSVYAETSHLAGLGFLTELRLLRLPVELVLLARPAREVARSLWRLDTIPGRTLRGHRYYLSPRDPALLQLPSDRLGELHDYQLCYWYAHELEARQAAWRSAAAEAGWNAHQLTTAELEGPQARTSIGQRLGLEGPRAGARILAPLQAQRHRNDKASKKLPRELSPDALDELERSVRDLWSRTPSPTAPPPSGATSSAPPTP